jgi:hypothetical protein
MVKVTAAIGALKAGARQKRHGEYAMILGGHYPEEHA